MSANLTLEELTQRLHYNPRTGAFTWLALPGQNNANKKFINKRAGSVDEDARGCRRRKITINRIVYPAARLAWFYMTGEWPPETVDHINQRGDDDRWDNLRLATHSQQTVNRRNWGKYPRGVSKHAHRGYVARIKKDGMPCYLGIFKTVEEAAAAYERAAADIHGVFYKLEYL